MLHRLKLRILYGEQLARDRIPRRSIGVILWVGVIVFIPFLFISYFLHLETRSLRLIVIGLLASLICVPVSVYSYTRGFGLPLTEVWRGRSTEIKYLAIKLGLIYSFSLYWMILGIVEFLFGYQTFRAMLISFVASAVARDSYVIGFLSAQAPQVQRKIFPDNRSMRELFRSSPIATTFSVIQAVGIAAVAGYFFGAFDSNPLHQALWVGLISGITATRAYCAMLPPPKPWRGTLRFFIWPGAVMGISYFVMLAYPVKKIFQVSFSPQMDMAVLSALCCGWLALASRFLGYLKTTSAA